MLANGELSGSKRTKNVNMSSQKGKKRSVGDAFKKTKKTNNKKPKNARDVFLKVAAEMMSSAGDSVKPASHPTVALVLDVVRQYTIGMVDTVYRQAVRRGAKRPTPLDLLSQGSFSLSLSLSLSSLHPFFLCFFLFI